MEMPELNEDLLEGGDGVEAAPDVPEPAVIEPAEALDGVVPQQEEGIPIDQTDDDTLDGTDLPKPDEEEMPEAVPPPEEEPVEPKETLDEPPVKKAKVDEDIPVPEVVEPGDQELPKQDEPEEDAGEDKAPAADGAQPDTDMLSTLASAALNQDEKPAEKVAEVVTVPLSPTKEEPPVSKKRTEQWHTVGVYENNTTTVIDYLASAVNGDDPVELATLNLGGRRITLEPGTAYKLRVCAVNSCGAGPWSEVAAFKTTLPGFPGAPSAIKISKSADGAHLTWEPPGGNSGEILEYAVYLAVRSASQGSQPVTTNQAQLAFVRVFCGPTNKCVVGPNSLQAAHIDTTTKPAIIFRIAARNAKGYGPATQVRWLQESANAPGSGAPTSGKRKA